jgi:hypothetical protein
MAVVFGFMRLMHGPVMTFAKATPAPEQHMTHHAAHHHIVPAQRAKPDSNPICNAFGCFIALDIAAIRAPVALLNPIGALSPGRTEALRAAEIEPAVPPPRLNV